MKKNKIAGNVFATAIVLGLLSGMEVHAALITWDAPSAPSADTDVSTDGTLLWATTLTTAANNDSQTINGVAFVPQTTQFGTNIDLNNGNLEYNDGHVDSGNLATLSTEYKELYAGDYFSADNGSSITLKNLIDGGQYQIQIWSGDDRYGSSSALNITGGLPDPTSLLVQQGSWAVGTFTADSTTQTLSFGNGGATVINAIQIRTIPEPGSTVLLGLGGLGLLSRRRRA